MRLDTRSFKVLLISIAILQSTASFAATVYRYTYHGATEYNFMTSDMPADLDKRSGYIDFAAPLATGINDYLTPLAYSFTDGITTVTEDSGYSLHDVTRFELDETGEIIDYALQLDFVFDGPAESRRHISFGFFATGEHNTYCPDVCTAENALGDGDLARTQDFVSDGISEPYWTTTVVPVPAAVWLFGSALAGLGWFRRRPRS